MKVVQERKYLEINARTNADLNRKNYGNNLNNLR